MTELLAYETAIEVRADEIISGDILDMKTAHAWERVLRVRYIEVDTPGCSDRVEVTVDTDSMCCTTEYRAGWTVRVIPGPMRRKS
jgi:hypothetical protein